MLIANEIINQWDWSSKSEIIEAMDEYARQVAIDFAVWIEIEGFLTGQENGCYFKWEGMECEGKPYSINELFELYIKSKK